MIIITSRHLHIKIFKCEEVSHLIITLSYKKMSTVWTHSDFSLGLRDIQSKNIILSQSASHQTVDVQSPMTARF